MLKYSINLIWSEEDCCYVARVSEFPGLSAFGETPEEAVKEAKIALDGFIKVYEEDGCSLPEPETLKQYSGQTRLRLPKSLHAALSEEAKIEGISLNSFIVYLLSEKHILKKVENEFAKLEEHVFLNSFPFDYKEHRSTSDVNTYSINLWDKTKKNWRTQ